MDLMEHAAGVWARKLVVLGVALAVAALVFVWRSSSPDQYVASSTVQVRVPDAQSSDPSLQVGYYADTVVGLVSTREVRERALEAAGSDQDVDDLEDDVTAEKGTQPGFVVVSATGESAQDAADLADAFAEVLGAEVADEQAADLAARRAGYTDAITQVGIDRREAIAADDKFALAALEREREALLGSLRTTAEQPAWRLAVVEPAEVPESPEAPRPLRDALLAFIVALVLAAEGVVIARAMRGSLSRRDPARDAATTTGVPAVLVGRDDGPTALAAVLPALDGARAVTVVQLDAAQQSQTAGLLARLLAARGEEVLLLDVATEPSLDRALDDATQPRVVVAADASGVDDLLEVSAALPDPTVVVVDARTTRTELRRAVAALQGLGLDVRAVAVQHGSPRSSSARRTDGVVRTSAGSGRS